MTPGNMLFIIIVSAAWIYMRLKDKSMGTGAYSEFREESRMSDAIALFGLFWLSFLPISIVAFLAISLSGGNFFILGGALLLVVSALCFSFKKTRLTPKAPGLDKVREKLNGLTAAKANITDIVSSQRNEKNESLPSTWNHRL